MTTTPNKTATVTYSGGFHNSPDMTLRVRVIERNGYRIGQLSDGQRARLNRHFCGITGCTCGGTSRADADLGELDGLE